MVSIPEPLSAWLGPESEKLKAQRELLAGLCLEAAKCLNQDLATHLPGDGALDPRLNELRRILLGREQATLARLEQRLEDPEELAAAVSHILPSAILKAAARDGRLSEVLAPTIEGAAQSSIRKDPRTLVSILYPLMGPAIRKSIAEAIGSMVQSLNEMLKHSLSWKGLKWRLEAYRSGTSYAETVLKHTLIYRVEHIFLIHKHTGLLLQHVAAEDAAAQDPEIVSSMLTAIQDFVRDSFSGTANADLDALRLGDLLVWCEQGPYAFLVAVIRGHPPEALHDVLRDALSTVHAEQGQALAGFDGDTAVFRALQDQLADCLKVQTKPPTQGTSPALWILFLLPVALALFGGYWLYQRYQDDRQWAAYIERLQAEPGIIVTGFERRDGTWHLTGLRDPLAADPEALMVKAKLVPARVSARWEPYQALHPAFVLKRIATILAPPSSVALALEGDTIRAHGSAPHAWIEQARRLGRTLPPGSPALDLGSVKDINHLEQLEFDRLRKAIASTLIYFARDDPLPAPDQEAAIDAVASQLRELRSLAQHLGLTVRVTIVGHADSTGKSRANLALSMGRCEAVRSLLGAKGVDTDFVFIRAAGPLEPLQAEVSDTDRARNRRASFTVGLIE